MSQPLVVSIQKSVCCHEDGHCEVCIRVYEQNPLASETVRDFGPERTDVAPTATVVETGEVVALTYDAVDGCYCGPATFSPLPGQTLRLEVPAVPGWDAALVMVEVQAHE